MQLPDGNIAPMQILKNNFDQIGPTRKLRVGFPSIDPHEQTVTTPPPPNPQQCKYNGDGAWEVNWPLFARVWVITPYNPYPQPMFSPLRIAPQVFTPGAHPDIPEKLCQLQTESTGSRSTSSRL